MKLKPCIKYNLHDKLLPISIFYIIFYSLLIFSYLVVKLNINNALSFNNVELASLVFIFIMGLNSFKSPFLFQMANGSSRKTVFTSFFACLIPISFLFSLTNTINAIVLPHFVKFEPMYGSLYCLSIYSNTRGLFIKMATTDFILSFIWLFLFHIAVASFGYFITLLYYRMNTLLKYIISFSVPLLLFFVIPVVIDYVQFHYQIYFFDRIFILFRLNPAISFITFPLIILFFAFFSFLLIRKAPVKQH